MRRGPETLIRHRRIDNDIAPFALAERPGGGLCAFWVDGRLERSLAGVEHDRGWQSDLAARLQRYFRGEPVEFGDVPLPDGPAFRRRCWEACRAVRPGTVTTYGSLAVAAGVPGAAANGARAAGQAMRHNPLPVIVPCHRVVAASGRLHGYAGSTDARGPLLDIKRALLRLEGAIGDGGDGLLF